MIDITFLTKVEELLQLDCDIHDRMKLELKNQERDELLDTKQYKIDDALPRNIIKFNIPNYSFYKDFQEFSCYFKIRGKTKDERIYCYPDKNKKLRILDVSPENVQSYYLSDEKEPDYEINNVFYWEKLYFFFSTEIADKNNPDGSFEIDTYEKGHITFSYNHYDKTYNNFNLELVYNRLINVYNKLKSSSNFQVLLKNRIIENNKKEEIIQIGKLYENLSKICDDTLCDYEIFTKAYPFDSYLKEYTDNINKIFEGTRDLVSKIKSNISTFVASVIGAIFTFDKVEHSLLLMFLYVIFILISVFCYLYFKSLSEDSDYLENSMNTTIAFYTKGSEVLESKIKDEKEHIEKKIKSIRTTIKIAKCCEFFIVLLFSCLLFVTKNPIINIKAVLKAF